MFAIAALLVGGASVDRASIGNVFLGVILFHTMFIVAPKTGAAITGDSMIGEYFRVFVSYAVITLALVMYESKKRKNKSLQASSWLPSRLRKRRHRNESKAETSLSNLSGGPAGGDRLYHDHHWPWPYDLSGQQDSGI